MMVGAVLIAMLIMDDSVVVGTVSWRYSSSMVGWWWLQFHGDVIKVNYVMVTAGSWRSAVSWRCSTWGICGGRCSSIAMFLM